MSFGRTKAVMVAGIDGLVVDVEVSVGQGLPKVVISGLPDTAVSQAPNRLRSAFVESELGFPDTRLSINLAPASVPKAGAALDLGMAVAILAATRAIDTVDAAQVAHVGELGMDGTVRPVSGVLPACLAVVREGVNEILVPFANAHEARLVHGLRVHPVRCLADVVAFHVERARGRTLDLPWPDLGRDDDETSDASDLRDVVGQFEARAALEVAAAGGHNVSMIGPPGAGKTLLASRLPGILPELTPEESLTVTSIQSVMGTLGRPALATRAPFVAPHHSTTMPGLVGGGTGRPRPGSVTEAHAGVLFLDEAPEFSRKVLDALRQPLERGFVTITRAQHAVRFPCRFQLVLASNPCPCGRFVGNGAGCTCAVAVRRNYLKQVSGPLLDRIDVHLQVPAVTRADLASGPGEPSASVAGRVLEVRERSRRRWRPLGLSLNAQVPGSILRSSPWALPASDTASLDQALDTASLTLRGYDATLRLAWTLCDLRAAPRPTKDDVYAALTLREGTRAA